MDAPHEFGRHRVIPTGVLALGWGAACVGWLARRRPLTRRPLSEQSASGAARALFDALWRSATVVVSARRRTALAVAVERDVADVVALVGLAVSAGCNLQGALDAAARHADGPLADALRTATATARRGERIADALEALPDQLGEGVRPFVAALVSCDRYGAALGSTLDRLALDVRTSSRQRAEAAARRLPVRLLFPLVTCILPAFALLTVAPLIAGSLRGLGL
jgi:Flp pilus assembly protein TadB